MEDVQAPIDPPIFRRELYLDYEEDVDYDEYGEVVELENVETYWNRLGVYPTRLVPPSIEVLGDL